MQNVTKVGPYTGRFRVVVFCATLSVFAAPGAAQDATTTSKTVALTVNTGLAIRLITTEKLRFKLNEPVRAKVTDPVYAFDREVIPSGAGVTGRIIGFRRPSRWIRAYALMGGNFTPLREPQIEFDTLRLREGTNLALATDVTPGTSSVVRFKDANAPSKGRLASMKEMARQQIEARKQAVVDAVKAPGKLDRIKGALWSLSPYRPQSLPSATRFTATLRSALDFGTVTLEPAEMDQVGTGPSPDIVNAVLRTALDSHTAQHGMAVEATISRPVFSPDNHLIYPEGSHLTGTVVQAQAARFWHRNGKLAFMFTGIEAPPSSVTSAPAVHPIEGRLEGVEVDGAAGDVRLDEEGGVTVANSKTRFIAPAISGLLAIRSTEGREAEPDNDADDVGLRPGQRVAAENSFGPRILSGGIGFGLFGAALGRLSQPVSSILGFYGFGRIAYSNIIGRGKEITFPQNTPLEIRLAP